MTIDKNLENENSFNNNIDDYHKQFIKSFEKVNFDTLPNENYTPMCDGATWTLERKIKDNFKAFNTNVPHGDFIKCCMQMVVFSGLQINEDDIY